MKNAGELQTTCTQFVYSIGNMAQQALNAFILDCSKESH
jgi:hypothetical protein